MWRRYFKLVGLVPGKVITQTHGAIDFSGDVPVETCKELFELDFPYLDITSEGKEKLYGIKPASNKKEENKTGKSGKRKKRITSTKRTYTKRKTSK